MKVLFTIFTVLSSEAYKIIGKWLPKLPY